MAFAPLVEINARNVAGSFREYEYGHYFEFSKPIGGIFAKYPQKVWVGDGGNYRWALVLKTVAHIVVDEDDAGKPVVEVWQIKNRRDYQV